MIKKYESITAWIKIKTKMFFLRRLVKIQRYYKKLYLNENKITDEYNVINTIDAVLKNKDYILYSSNFTGKVYMENRKLTE